MKLCCVIYAHTHLRRDIKKAAGAGGDGGRGSAGGGDGGGNTPPRMRAPLCTKRLNPHIQSKPTAMLKPTSGKGGGGEAGLSTTV